MSVGGPGQGGKGPGAGACIFIVGIRCLRINPSWPKGVSPDDKRVANRVVRAAPETTRPVGRPSDVVTHIAE